MIIHRNLLIDGDWTEDEEGMELRGMKGWRSHCATIGMTVEALTLEELKEKQEAAVDQFVLDAVEVAIEKARRQA